MPAVAGGDQHGIDVRPLGQKLAEVAIRGTILAAVPAVTMFLIARRGPPDVADRHELHVGFASIAQVAAAPAAEADAAEDDPLAGGRLAAGAQLTNRGQGKGARTRPPDRQDACPTTIAARGCRNCRRLSGDAAVRGSRDGEGIWA